ncbi:MAG: hypothetical protein ACI97A_000142 [Planctomycetota bacterium]|jgi:hypothetical protein
MKHSPARRDKSSTPLRGWHAANSLIEVAEWDLLRKIVNKLIFLHRFFDFWNMEGSKELTGVSLAPCPVVMTTRHTLLHDSSAQLVAFEEKP